MRKPGNPPPLFFTHRPNINCYGFHDMVFIFSIPLLKFLSFFVPVSDSMDSNTWLVFVFFYLTFKFFFKYIKRTADIGCIFDLRMYDFFGHMVIYFNRVNTPLFMMSILMYID